MNFINEQTWDHESKGDTRHFYVDIGRGQNGLSKCDELLFLVVQELKGLTDGVHFKAEIRHDLSWNRDRFFKAKEVTQLGKDVAHHKNGRVSPGQSVILTRWNGCIGGSVIAETNLPSMAVI